jgi:hypothetical protein
MRDVCLILATSNWTGILFLLCRLSRPQDHLTSYGFRVWYARNGKAVVDSLNRPSVTVCEHWAALCLFFYTQSAYRYIQQVVASQELGIATN